MLPRDTALGTVHHCKLLRCYRYFFCVLRACTMRWATLLAVPALSHCCNLQHVWRWGALGSRREPSFCVSGSFTSDGQRISEAPDIDPWGAHAVCPRQWRWCRPALATTAPASATARKATETCGVPPRCSAWPPRSRCTPSSTWSRCTGGRLAHTVLTRAARHTRRPCYTDQGSSVLPVWCDAVAVLVALCRTVAHCFCNASHSVCCM
jgi:hypothetical protein